MASVLNWSDSAVLASVSSCSFSCALARSASARVRACARSACAVCSSLVRRSAWRRRRRRPAARRRRVRRATRRAGSSAPRWRTTRSTSARVAWISTRARSSSACRPAAACSPARSRSRACASSTCAGIAGLRQRGVDLRLRARARQHEADDHADHQGDDEEQGEEDEQGGGGRVHGVHCRPATGSPAAPGRREIRPPAPSAAPATAAGRARTARGRAARRSRGRCAAGRCRPASRSCSSAPAR